MKNTGKYLLIILILCITACEREDISFEKLNGYVQKGPYLNGTSLTVSELSKDLSPTGRNFNTQLLDNKGTFELKNVELSSHYVMLKADGFYFNEVKNINSTGQLTLFALSDLSDKTSLNVNVLSSLEKSRVEYLISNGTNFSIAKKQAQSEILSIFEITRDDLIESELLDISKSGDDNGILLAISVILQGYLPVSDLSELLANISTDLREDGILNSQTLGSTLINNAKGLKLDAIRQNLENRYETLGSATTVANFEKYVYQFIENTEFEFTGFINYPASGLYGTNLLDKQETDYNQGYHSLCAVLPEGNNLKVKIQGFNWYYPTSQDWSSWEQSDWNFADTSRTFTSKKTGEIDMKILLEIDNPYSPINIYVYENEDQDPTWSKAINIK